MAGVPLSPSAKLAGVGKLAGRLPIYAALVFCPVNFLAREIRAAPVSPEQFVGAAGCKASSCHGGAGEKRSQYLTWVKQDFHFRAYAVLVDARSARMAETLGLPAAYTSARCTVCHSPFQAVAPTNLANTASADEGVSCESCHGAAGSWLRGHIRKDWSYAMRVGAGMHDLRNFYVRANTCVACHQNLDANLLAAGHPELIFELDGQSVNEPKHWRDDDAWSGARAWLVGQAVALREVSWMLAKTEFTTAEGTWRWNALVWLLAKATAHQARLQSIDLPGPNVQKAQFAIMQEQADLLARQASAMPWDRDRAATMLRTLAASEPDFMGSPGAEPDVLFPRASRLVLALDRLARAVAQEPPAPPIAAALAALFEDVRAQPDFQPAKFAADLTIFRKTIGDAPE